MDFKDFFKQPIIIVLIIIAALLLSLMAYSLVSDGNMTFFQNAIGAVFSPLQKGATAVSNFVDKKLSYFTDFDDLKTENEELKSKLRQEKVDAERLEKLEQENKQLKNYLGLKDEHPDYELVYCDVVAREAGNFYSIFTIDRGTRSGIKLNDMVVTPDGVVGIVSQVGSDFAKVSTIIESTTAIGAVIVRSRDVAILEGDTTLANDGLCKLSLLQSIYSAQQGDVVQTSGIGGTFPKGLILGTVTKVYENADGATQNAVVEPAVNLNKISSVIVITDFQKDTSE